MAIPAVTTGGRRSAARRALERAASSRAGAWFYVHVAQRVDPVLLRLSGGKVSSAVLTPVVLLTTTGARSGVERTTPLIYFTDDDRVVLIASNGGSPRHPAWFHNVRAHPSVRLWAGGREGRYRGHEAEGEERARLWAAATCLYAGYDAYQRRAGQRRIPVMVFEPEAPAASR